MFSFNIKVLPIRKKIVLFCYVTHSSVSAVLAVFDIIASLILSYNYYYVLLYEKSGFFING